MEVTKNLRRLDDGTLADRGGVVARGGVRELVAAHATPVVEFTFGPWPPLVGVEVIQPNLEAVYLVLTGRRY